MKLRYLPFALPLLLLAIAPMYLQAVGSITGGRSLMEGFRLWPQHPTLRAYRDFVGMGGMRWAANSALIGVLAALGQTLVAGLAGYAFAWKQFPGREAIFWLLVASMALPTQALLVPRFVLVRRLGLSGYPALLLAYWIATGNVLLVRQFARSLPAEILDAAKLDGASEWALLRRVVLPCLGPVLAFVAIGAFVSSWVDLFWPQLLLRGEAMTLACGLFWLQQQQLAEYGLRFAYMMAGGVISLAPILVLFLACQKHIERGIEGAWE